MIHIQNTNKKYQTNESIPGSPPLCNLYSYKGLQPSHGAYPPLNIYNQKMLIM